MGNALMFPDDSDSSSLEQQNVPSDETVSAIAHDLSHFDSTSQVPEGLSNYVESSKKAQANWYRKLVDAWKEAKPPPRNPEEEAALVIQTLERHKNEDVQGLLAFYDLPKLHTLEKDKVKSTSSLPHGVKFEMNTLAVEEKGVADGDSITVYVSTADPRESSFVPRNVHEAALQRSEALDRGDNAEADAFHKQIVDSGYRMVKFQNDEILARKYRIRLRGIDAPESSMPYGKAAKKELTYAVGGKSLRILVYGQDRYGRSVGDVYCNGIFVQELMLKKGLAWHYTRYDSRPELEKWESEARERRVGLWALPNPEKPWDWRKDKREAIMYISKSNA